MVGVFGTIITAQKVMRANLYAARMAPLLIEGLDSLLRSLFWDITQRSPKETAAHIRATFLSRN